MPRTLLALFLIGLIGSEPALARAKAVRGDEVKAITYQLEDSYPGGLYQVQFVNGLHSSVLAQEGCTDLDLVFIAVDGSTGYATDEIAVRRMISQLELAMTLKKQVTLWIDGCLPGPGGRTYGKVYLVRIND